MNSLETTRLVWTGGAAMAVAAYAIFLLPRVGRRSVQAVLGLLGVVVLLLLKGSLGWWLVLPLAALGVGHVSAWPRAALRRASGALRPPGSSDPAKPQAASRDAPVAISGSLATTASFEPRQGDRFGRYVIDGDLGRGSMGTVYLGHDAQTGQQAAIKTVALRREFSGADLAEARSRFFMEAAMAGRLRHPDIVTVFEAGEQNGLAYLAMEFVHGRDLLAHTVPGQLLPISEVLRVSARVADALAYAHTQGVVHRDVKPANVMFDATSNTLKVADFGIASIVDARNTRTGRILGTPSFMSPEQMASGRIDGRSDLYSLGVTLFQLLTGALPYVSNSMAELMHQLANRPAPDVRTLRPDVPEALAQLVSRALEKRPERRPGNGTQFANALRAVLSGLETAPSALSSGPDLAEPVQSGTFPSTEEFSAADPRHNSIP